MNITPDTGASPFSARKVFDKQAGLYAVKIFSGDCYATDQRDEMMVTILGSCIAACIRDPHAGVGGMNHFLLPGDEDGNPLSATSTRYGAFAMESLINGIIRLGGRKDRLEVKVFGGGNVANNMNRIGSRNAEFIRKFLKNEGFTALSQDLEGDLPRRVHYYPATGDVMLRKLRKSDSAGIVSQENDYRSRLSVKPVEGDIDLF